MAIKPENDLFVRSREVLLDALDALATQRDAVVVVGAQAVYLQTGGIAVALSEATKDSDVALDPRLLHDDPRVEAAMRAAGFLPSASDQPGSWISMDGIPVDVMVPELLAGTGAKNARAAKIPPHDKRASRRARGLEAVIVDHEEMTIRSLVPDSSRNATALVAGVAGLLVAKLHKVAERVGQPDRLNDKDAHDIYRLLLSRKAEDIGAKMKSLLEDDLSRVVTEAAVTSLHQLFAISPDALGAVMAGRAEEGVGEPETVSASVSVLAGDVLAFINEEEAVGHTEEGIA